MSNYRDMVMQDLRLVMLRLLAAASGYTLNRYVLQRELEAAGHRESSDTLTAQLHWLQEQGLVELVDDPKLLVATLRERGLDVAEGRATIPGVQRPRPA